MPLRVATALPAGQDTLGDPKRAPIETVLAQGIEAEYPPGASLLPSAQGAETPHSGLELSSLNGGLGSPAHQVRAGALVLSVNAHTWLPLPATLNLSESREAAARVDAGSQRLSTGHVTPRP